MSSRTMLSPSRYGARTGCRQGDHGLAGQRRHRASSTAAQVIAAINGIAAASAPGSGDGPSYQRGRWHRAVRAKVNSTTSSPPGENERRSTAGAPVPDQQQARCSVMFLYARSTPVSGRPASPAWRPPSGSARATTRRTRRPRSYSTRSRSSSSPTATPTAGTGDVRQPRRSGATWSTTARSPTSVGRNHWGVDLNRNNTEYSRRSTATSARPRDCTGRHVRRPPRRSEPEIKNEKWVADTYPNIKFANNIHSFGGYFMWAPGAYKDDGTAHHGAGAEHRHREVLLRGRREDPRAASRSTATR